MSYRVEKREDGGRDIVIDGWNNGIANGPYAGIADMRNVDPVTIPGEVSVAMATEAMITQGAISGVTFTVDPATEIFTYNGTIPLEINTAITFTNSGGALPAGLSANTAYYIKTIPTPTTFTISAVSAGGATKDVTGAGSGTNTFSTIQMGTPSFYTDYVFNMYRYYFALDSNGRCWIYDSSNLGLGSTNKWIYMNNKSSESDQAGGNGLQAYKGYLFWFTSTQVNVIRILNPSSYLPNLAYLTTKTSWVMTWKALVPSTNIPPSHFSLIGQDDIVYFCNDVSIGSIGTIPDSLVSEVNTTFNIAETHTVADGVTTNGSPNISTVTAFFQSTDVGAVIVGTGIPTGTTIASVTDSKNAVLAINNATASNTGLTFTITKAYSFSSSALDLPSNDSAVCLAELGTNLMIGGINNKIYPWNRISPSFNFPIFLSENYVARMVTINTTMYIFCGYKGRIFVTNGSNTTLLIKMPDYLSQTTNPYIVWKDAVFNNNQIYFGFSCTNNAGTTINQYGGLWAISVDSTQSPCPRLQNIMSYGTYSGYVSAIYQNRGLILKSTPSNDGYGLFIGWYSGSVGGIDKGISTPYTGGQAYIDSEMIPIGLFSDKKNFENLEFKLATPLVAGESVAIHARKYVTASYVEVPVTQGGAAGDISGTCISNIEDLEWIQLRTFLTSTASSPSFTRLREIRIRI